MAAPTTDSVPAPAGSPTPPALNGITTSLPYELEVNDDADSALGTDDESISTSVRSSIFQFRQENGRTYHAYKNAQYEYPNDENEQDRLDRQHYLYNLILGGKNFLAPIRDDCKNVLDIGTGTGIWALEFADAYPAATILGTELSPIQPPFLPPNCHFLIDDANEDWEFDDKFDYIHARLLHSAVEEKKLFRQAFDSLAPGGWFETAEAIFPLSCDDDTLDPKSYIAQYGNNILKSSQQIGQSLDNSLHYAQWMREAGFVDVHEVIYKAPIGPWARGEKEQEIGWWALDNFLDAIATGCMPLFTRALGWSPEEVQVFSAFVRKEIRNTAIHVYFRAAVVYGRKPE